MNLNKSHWYAFAFCNIAAFLLLLSWSTPFTKFHWDVIDTQLFYYFNGWVANSHAAQFFWAIANVRAFDLIPFLVILYSVTVADRFIAKDKIKNGFLMFSIMIVFLLFIRFLIERYFNIHRASPSMVLHPAYLLRDLVPSVPCKDASGGSFPGDHAAIIFAWVGFIFLYAKDAKYKILTVLIAGFFTLPRLVAGAHWFTDDFVGGMFVALISLSWIFFTPIAQFVTFKLQPVCDWCIANLLPHCIRKITYERG